MGSYRFCFVKCEAYVEFWRNSTFAKVCKDNNDSHGRNEEHQQLYRTASLLFHGNYPYFERHQMAIIMMNKSEAFTIPHLHMPTHTHGARPSENELPQRMGCKWRKYDEAMTMTMMM